MVVHGWPGSVHRVWLLDTHFSDNATVLFDRSAYVASGSPDFQPIVTVVVEQGPSRVYVCLCSDRSMRALLGFLGGECLV